MKSLVLYTHTHTGNLKEKRGITLIALIITIIILLILAGITIGQLAGSGLLGKAKEAKIKSEIAEIKEQIQTDILGGKLENQEGISENSLKRILESYGTIIYEEDEKTIKGVKTKNYEILLSEVYSGTTGKPDGVLATTAITKDNYGDSVDYEANGITNWKVFLNDGTNIFIIAGDCVTRSKMLLKDSFRDWGEQGNDYYVDYYDNSDLLSWLQEPSYWIEYSKGIEGSTAYGGPTLTQFIQSYNQKNGTQYSDNNQQGQGFLQNIQDVLYLSENGLRYYLSTIAPSWYEAMWIVTDSGSLGGISKGNWGAGVRPLVKLPLDLYGNKIDGKWKFYK